MLSPLSPLDVSIHLQPATFWESGTIKPVGLTTGLNIGSKLLSPLSPQDVSIHLQPATFWESGIIKPVGLTTGLKRVLPSDNIFPDQTARNPSKCYG